MAERLENAARIAERIDNNPVTGSPHDMRRSFAALASDGPSGVEARIAGTRTVRFGSGPPAIWFHGGGYVFGTPETHAKPAHYLAENGYLTVYLPAYRRAPEHIWPAQLEDACRLLNAFANPVPLIGDSAGGHLAVAAARRHPDNVSALVLISPNTDRTGQSATRRANQEQDLMNDDRSDKRLADMAMPHLEDDDPDASPILADLSELPRTFITASTREVLLDDSLLLIRQLGLSGVPVSAEITDAPCHMWTLWPDELPQAIVTLDRIASFLDTPDIRKTATP